MSEIGEQLFKAGEAIGTFPVSDVFVVALASFVVIAEDANLIDDESQTVFQAVSRTDDRDGHFPNNDCDKAIICQLRSFSEKKSGRHVGIYTNGLIVRQSVRAVAGR